MSIILGIDIGDKRVGYAFSDGRKELAFPQGTISGSKKDSLRELIEIINKNGINEVVVGLPLSDDGSENEQCQNVKNFVNRLKKRVDVKVYYVDEYCSSIEAEEQLRRKSLSRKKKEDIDAVAATIILQRHLDG